MAQGAIHSTWITSLQSFLMKLADTVVMLGLVTVSVQDSSFHQRLVPALAFHVVAVHTSFFSIKTLSLLE